MCGTWRAWYVSAAAADHSVPFAQRSLLRAKLGKVIRKVVDQSFLRRVHPKLPRGPRDIAEAKSNHHRVVVDNNGKRPLVCGNTPVDQVRAVRYRGRSDCLSVKNENAGTMIKDLKVRSLKLKYSDKLLNKTNRYAARRNEPVCPVSSRWE